MLEGEVNIDGIAVLIALTDGRAIKWRLEALLAKLYYGLPA